MTLNYPFAIISDVHMNDWSQYSHVGSDKLNSRLKETMEAVEEAANALLKAGGKDLVVTGDLFHTRGKMKPSVFNPVLFLFRELATAGIRIHMIPGNHDLEGRDACGIESAIEAFMMIDGVQIYNKPTVIGNCVFIPWIETKEEFIRTIDTITKPEDKIVFCHIGIDGVLDKVAGKVGKAVLDKGFKYVFAGDYHNHKSLGNGIYSVGALTQHSFSDIDSVAGYLIVNEDRVDQYETKAPKFVDYPAGPFNGNIVRVTGEHSESEIELTLEALKKLGAKHVVDLSSRPTIKDTSKSTTVVRVDLDIKEALESFTKRRFGENFAPVLEEAKRIIEDV